MPEAAMPMPASSGAASGRDTEPGGATLTVHFLADPAHTEAGSLPVAHLSAFTLAGQLGSPAEAEPTSADACGWLSRAFRFATAQPDAYLGFEIATESAYPQQRRFVRAAGGKASVWVIDGDPRVYGAPLAIDPPSASDTPVADDAAAGGGEPGPHRILTTDNGSRLLVPQFVAYDTLQPVGDPALVGFDRERLSAIAEYVTAQVDQGAPSLAIGIVKDGKIVTQAAYGFAKKYATHVIDGEVRPAELLSPDQWQNATVDTLYDLASNTKMYAANYAIQHLVSEGTLELERTLASFPGWENFTDAASCYTGHWRIGGSGGIDRVHTGKATITIADLLHHTAGQLPDPRYHNRSVAGELYYHSADIHDRRGIIDVICRTPLFAAPHTEFRYSDLDYIILGILVEQLTGRSLDDYLQETFYGPLKLEHTTFAPLMHGFDAARVAATELNGNTRDGAVDFGHFDDGSPVPIRRYTLQGEVHDEKAYHSMGQVSGHAGLFSTVGDLAVLTQLMLNGGIYAGRRYFSQETIERFTAAYALDAAQRDLSTIGLGWRVQSATGEGYHYFNDGPSRSSYGHTGWTGTLTIIDPVYNMTITILTNKRHSPVVDPPDGFAADRFPIAELVPVVARVYAALLPDAG